VLVGMKSYQCYGYIFPPLVGVCSSACTLNYMLHDCSRATSLFMDAQPAALHLAPDNQ